MRPIRKRARGADAPLYHWRDVTGHEIDVLIDLGGSDAHMRGEYAIRPWVPALKRLSTPVPRLSPAVIGPGRPNHGGSPRDRTEFDLPNPDPKPPKPRFFFLAGLATNKPAEFIVLRISQDTRALEAELAAAGA